MLIPFRESLEYLTGERDQAPAAVQCIPPWVARYVVWIVSILIIYAFCGQSSKFIYIDF